ncbi:hypothetical protein ACFPN2_17335 [Steroidobacter flavus]|uniref:Uncharacterized protein n=1 Tax=Steroidobacter flavus TaxID=1842136 RepID=A0ABV8SUZ8_9GAMM
MKIQILFWDENEKHCFVRNSDIRFVIFAKEIRRVFPYSPLQSLFRRLPPPEVPLFRQKLGNAQIDLFATAQDYSRSGGRGRGRV